MLISKIENIKPGQADYFFFCPGCGAYHFVWVSQIGYTGPCWNFNFDLTKPTISPSILTRWHDNKRNIDMICHLFIKEGKIQYLSDCTHELANQTIDMVDC